MIKLFKSSLVIVVFFTLFACEKKVEENEPNDLFSQSNPIAPGEPVLGSLESIKDVDNYFYSFRKKGVISLELTGLKGVNHAIKIWKIINKDPRLEKIIDDNRKSSPENFVNLSVTPGDYVFSIIHGRKDKKRGNPHSQYKFLMKFADREVGELEPNDSSAGACAILPDETMSGFFSPGINFLNKGGGFREEDWFSFHVDAQSLPIVFTAQISDVPGIDSVISLYNPEMKELFSFDENPAGKGEHCPEIALPWSGTYYIKVFAKNFMSNGVDSYELRFNLKVPQSGRELESNDVPHAANALSEAGLLGGKISFKGDVDYINPGVETMGFFNIKLRGAARNLKLQIVRNGNAIETFDKSLNTSVLLLPNVKMMKNDLILISGDYDISGDNDYEIIIKPLVSSDKLEEENNDVLKKANILAGEVRGFISHDGDVDYYKIITDGRKKFQITIEGVKEGKISLSTTDPLGYIIKTVDVVGDSSKKITELVNRQGYIIVQGKSPSSERGYYIKLREVR